MISLRPSEHICSKGACKGEGKRPQSFESEYCIKSSIIHTVYEGFGTKTTAAFLCFQVLKTNSPWARTPKITFWYQTEGQGVTYISKNCDSSSLFLCMITITSQ